MGDNFWSWILAWAIQNIQDHILPMFPQANAMINFASPIATGFWVFIQLTVIGLGSVFDLRLFGVWLGMAIMVKLMQVHIVSAQFVMKYLPKIIEFIGAAAG